MSVTSANDPKRTCTGSQLVSQKGGWRVLAMNSPPVASWEPRRLLSSTPFQSSTGTRRIKSDNRASDRPGKQRRTTGRTYRQGGVDASFDHDDWRLVYRADDQHGRVRASAAKSEQSQRHRTRCVESAAIRRADQSRNRQEGGRSGSGRGGETQLECVLRRGGGTFRRPRLFREFGQLRLRVGRNFAAQGSLLGALSPTNSRVRKTDWAGTPQLVSGDPRCPYRRARRQSAHRRRQTHWRHRRER